MAHLDFLGAAGTVTGSKFLLTAGNRRVMVDCGLFQGVKKLRLRNWEPLPLEAASVDTVLLTHAHIDHTGYLPRLIRDGFAGPIQAAQATAELAGIMLPDSGHLQEEEAAYHNRRGTSKHSPALPLYTEVEGRRAAARIKPVPYAKPIDIGGGITATFRRAGHILGSAHITLDYRENGTRRTVVFSGDLGRYHSPLIPDAKPIADGADYILVESTYGDRVRDFEPISEQLERVILDVVKRGGALVIPAFAVGRTQEMVLQIAKLEQAGRIPVVPTIIDSPMAIDVTGIYCEHRDDFDEDIRPLVESGECPLETRDFTVARSQEESKAINRRRGPFIVISASGMATGGRILHHLKNRLPDPRSTVLLVGYQAHGTRGRRLQDGEGAIRIFGEDVPVRARIETLHGLSAHADSNELMRWLRTCPDTPRQVFVIHGEPESSGALAERITDELGWKARIPGYGDRVELD
jgi:metallo-beta-lactamase family protein